MSAAPASSTGMVFGHAPWLTPPEKAKAITEGASAFQLNRPGSTDLASFIQLHNLSYAIVWRMVWGGGTERIGCYIQKGGVDLPERLRVDRLASCGEFAAASDKHRFVGWSGDKINPGSSLPALAFERRDWAFLEDMQDEMKTDDQRQELARRHHVRGCFAMFRDGAVFEFGRPDRIDEEAVKSLVAQFGGTRGPVVEDVSSLDRRAGHRHSRKVSYITPGTSHDVDVD